MAAPFHGVLTASKAERIPPHCLSAPSSVPEAPSSRLVVLGDVLFQMAEVHRQIQNQLEEMVSTCWCRGAQPGQREPL